MFFETSAKSAENVEEIYLSVAERLKEAHIPIIQPTPKKSNCLKMKDQQKTFLSEDIPKIMNFVPLLK